MLSSFAGNKTINGKNHETKIGGTCKASSIIYGVKCIQCDKWYVGESGMKMHERLNAHRYSINKLKKGGTLDKSNDTGLADHFSEGGHNFDKDAELYILENGNWNTVDERQAKESFYICRYGTMEPVGLNKKAGFLGDIYQKMNGMA